MGTYGTLAATKLEPIPKQNNYNVKVDKKGKEI